MKRTVVYRGLWLLSERDKSGRLIQFHEKRNLFAGENETGKSRILKHIVWALGGEPAARDAGNWDVNMNRPEFSRQLAGHVQTSEGVSV